MSSNVECELKMHLTALRTAWTSVNCIRSVKTGLLISNNTVAKHPSSFNNQDRDSSTIGRALSNWRDGLGRMYAVLNVNWKFNPQLHCSHGGEIQKCLGSTLRPRPRCVLWSSAFVECVTGHERRCKMVFYLDTTISKTAENCTKLAPMFCSWHG